MLAQCLEDSLDGLSAVRFRFGDWEHGACEVSMLLRFGDGGADLPMMIRVTWDGASVVCGSYSLAAEHEARLKGVLSFEVESGRGLVDALAERLPLPVDVVEFARLLRMMDPKRYEIAA